MKPAWNGHPPFTFKVTVYGIAFYFTYKVTFYVFAVRFTVYGFAVCFTVYGISDVRTFACSGFLCGMRGRL